MKATDIHVYRNYISAKGLKNRRANYLMQEMLTVLKTKHHHDNQECQFFVKNLLFCWACWVLVQGSTKGKIKYSVYLFTSIFMYLFIVVLDWEKGHACQANTVSLSYTPTPVPKLKILNPCYKSDGVINPLDKNYSIIIQIQWDINSSISLVTFLRFSCGYGWSRLPSFSIL